MLNPSLGTFILLVVGLGGHHTGQKNLYSNSPTCFSLYLTLSYEDLFQSWRLPLKLNSLYWWSKAHYHSHLSGMSLVHSFLVWLISSMNGHLTAWMTVDQTPWKKCLWLMHRYQNGAMLNSLEIDLTKKICLRNALLFVLVCCCSVCLFIANLFYCIILLHSKPFDVQWSSYTMFFVFFLLALFQITLKIYWVSSKKNVHFVFHLWSVKINNH